MGLRRTSLVLYILFILPLQYKFSSVTSQPSSVAMNHETLSFSASKPDAVVFVGKSRPIAVVIKRRGGGGGRSRSRGGPGVVYTGRSHSHHSSSSRNLRGGVCAICWLGLSVVAGLILVT